MVSIVERTFLFAEKILDAYLILRENGHFKLADQFVSAGTSIGANVEEAQAAHSKLDFICKRPSLIRKLVNHAIGLGFWIKKDCF